MSIDYRANEQRRYEHDVVKGQRERQERIDHARASIDDEIVLAVEHADKKLLRMIAEMSTFDDDRKHEMYQYISNAAIHNAVGHSEITGTSIKADGTQFYIRDKYRYEDVLNTGSYISQVSPVDYIIEEGECFKRHIPIHIPLSMSNDNVEMTFKAIFNTYCEYFKIQLYEVTCDYAGASNDMYFDGQYKKLTEATGCGVEVLDKLDYDRAREEGYITINQCPSNIFHHTYVIVFHSSIVKINGKPAESKVNIPRYRYDLEKFVKEIGESIGQLIVTNYEHKRFIKFIDNKLDVNHNNTHTLIPYLNIMSNIRRDMYLIKCHDIAIANYFGDQNAVALIIGDYNTQLQNSTMNTVPVSAKNSKYIDFIGHARQQRWYIDHTSMTKALLFNHYREFMKTRNIEVKDSAIGSFMSMMSKNKLITQPDHHSQTVVFNKV